MRNETKAELLKLHFRRYLDGCDRSDGDRPAKALQKILRDQSHLLDNYRDMLLYQEKLLASIRRNLGSVRKVKKSMRWKVGNILVRQAERLLVRKRKETELDRLERETGRVLEESRKIRAVYEPPHYLHPDYLLQSSAIVPVSAEKEGWITIIILNHNGERHLKDLFDSFLKYNTWKNFNVIVADLGSSDGSADLINSYKDRLPVDLYKFDRNLTFSYSNNRAAEKAVGEFLLFLNNDIIFTSDIIGKMGDELSKSSGKGVIGTVLHNPATDLSTPGSVRHAGIYFEYIKGSTPALNAGKPQGQSELGADEYGIKEMFRPFNCKDLPDSVAVNPPAVTGAALMIRRRDFVSLNGFDENFINGYEDVDLCLSCSRKLGKDVVLLQGPSMIRNESVARNSLPGNAAGIRAHNLDVLNHKHGMYVKRRYFQDLMDGEGRFTRDSDVPSFIGGLQTGKNHALRVSIKNPAPSGPGAENWGDTHFARSLAKALTNIGFVVRIDPYDEWYDHGYLEDDVAIVLRGNRRYYPRQGQVNIMWNISHPEVVESDEYNGYDQIFVPSQKYLEELEVKLQTGISLLQQCTDTELFFPDIDQSVENFDYLFVGNPRGQLRKSVKLCMDNGIDLGVFGKGWDKIIPEKYIKGTYLPNDKLRYYYSSCKVLFNDHWDDMASKGFISNRLFDAVACGCTVISDRVEGIKELFGDSVLVYDSAEEFRRLTEAVRNEFSKFKSVSAEYSRLVRERHSFDVRARAIGEIIRRLVEEKSWSAGK